MVLGAVVEVDMVVTGAEITMVVVQTEIFMVETDHVPTEIQPDNLCTKNMWWEGFLISSIP